MINNGKVWDTADSEIIRILLKKKKKIVTVMILRIGRDKMVIQYGED